MNKYIMPLGWILAISMIVVGAVGVSPIPVSDYTTMGWEWATGTVATSPDVVVVEVSMDRTAATASVWASKEVFDARKKCKSFRWVTGRQLTGTDVSDVQWALDATAKLTDDKFPVVCTRKGSKVTVTTLPKTPAGMVSFLQKNGAI